MADYIVTTRDLCVVYRKVLVRNAASADDAEQRVATNDGILVFAETPDGTVDGDILEVREAEGDEAILIALGSVPANA